MLQILELFGGIGSPRIALRNIGVPVKAIDYVEIDEKAVRSYNAMFANELPHKTQSVVGWNLKPDILIHGSPCQDFSIAGHQKGADEGTETRSSLMWETIHIIQQMGEWKPRYVIWENVKGVRHKAMIHNFNRYLSEMENLGYANSFECLDAREFGLPQARERVFTISCLDGTHFNFDNLIRTPMRDISEFLTDDFSKEHIVTQPSMLKLINGTSNSKFNGRVDIIKEFCHTITCKQMRSQNSGVIDLGNGTYRYLTERECWRLQGYADIDYDNVLFVHPGTKGKLNGAMYKQSGNSIPVTIFESIFRKIVLGEVNEAELSGQLSIQDFISTNNTVEKGSETMDFGFYNMDCMDGMKEFPDKYFELAIVDPPYFTGPNKRQYYGQKINKLNIQRKDYQVIEKWDIPNEDYFKELFRVSKNQIVWGCNYFNYQFGAGRIIWDKCNSTSSFSDCEIAYCSMHDSVRLFRFMWNGMLQGKSITEGHIMQGDKRKNEFRIHPTQKPVALYEWQLMKYASKGDKILDTHVGSASSLIACYNLGFDCVGFETDKNIYDLANNRLEEIKAQINVFDFIERK